jgi:hypothetical protein
VYAEGDSFRISLPFNIRALDEENVPNLFSNLGADQPSQFSYIRFPQGKLSERQYKLVEKFIITLGNSSLTNYHPEIEYFSTERIFIN